MSDTPQDKPKVYKPLPQPVKHDYERDWDPSRRHAMESDPPCRACGESKHHPSHR